MKEKTRRVRASAVQYEPLNTPEKWAGDEKRFALRLTQLMDEVFGRLSSLYMRVSALEERLEKEEGNG